MADFVDIVSLNLGNTFGGWYNKTTEMITRLNALNVANIIGGDGITASPHTAANGGYTLSLSGTVTKNMVFDGNVTVNGTLTSNFAGAVSGTTVVLPANTGVTVGNIVYIDSTGKVEKALADDECTAEVVGIVIGFTGGNAQVATTGKISGSSIIEAFTGTVGATLQKGVVYFLSGGVSGAGTTLEPDVTSYVSKPMLLGLTGDSGLILPYRGFIATEGTLGNTTIVQGVCGGSGVLSVNGLTASIFLNSQSPANRKITGHIHAVNAINLGDDSGIVAKTVILNSSKYTSRKNPGIATYAPESYGFSNNINVSALDKTNVNKHTPTPSDKIYLSTLGTIDDVYKLHRIRITSTNLTSVRINFVINKTYNNLGSSNFKEEFGALNGNFTQSYIEYRMKNCVILGEDNSISYSPGLLGTSYYLGLASPSVSATGIHTIAGNMMTPILRTPYGGSSSTGITASTATGVLDSAGVYPVIYSTSDFTNQFAYADQYNRVYAWQFNSVILTGTQVSGYINTISTSVDFNPSDGNGFTLDSSVLGWNTRTGAIPETVAISFPSLDNYYNSTLQPESLDLHTMLEVYKYNPTSGVTGPIIMIPKDFTYSTNFTTSSGSVATNIGTA
jgi:hypothetical protein